MLELERAKALNGTVFVDALTRLMFQLTLHMNILPLSNSLIRGGSGRRALYT